MEENKKDDWSLIEDIIIDSRKETHDIIAKIASNQVINIISQYILTGEIVGDEERFKFTAGSKGYYESQIKKKFENQIETIQVEDSDEKMGRVLFLIKLKDTIEKLTNKKC